ncbi:unnamed protein product [Rhizoctonia solani]|uniref:Fungal-type protein kinase domain-containing protein n=1 Tax=Rhizoctonia solani TaxID=456999 RepID=A0A8H3GJ43_9AGAM|nr:unnamed protein product [Rhizoctonia solani]
MTLFMAIRLLRAIPEERIAHTFLHDLESFFWVVLTVIANHQKNETSPLSDAVNRVLNRPNLIDCLSLGNAKYAMLIDIVDGELDVRTFGTAWAKSLAAMVQEFAKWIRQIRKPGFDSTADPDACFEKLLDIFLETIPHIRPDAGSLPVPSPETDTVECIY